MNDNQSTDEQRRKLTTRIAQEEQRISELHTELEQRRALVQKLKDGSTEEKLRLPFSTVVLGIQVTVEKIDLNEAGEIVAVCARRPERQRIPVVDLPLPSVRPEGTE